LGQIFLLFLFFFLLVNSGMVSLSFLFLLGFVSPYSGFVLSFD